MTQIEMDLRTEIAVLKDQMNALINTAIEKVDNLDNCIHTNAGMGGFEYSEPKSPLQVKFEVIKILQNLRPKVGE